MAKYQPGRKIDRQWGTKLEEIRQDHLNRYQFAAQRILPKSKVADVACGCGYGSWMLYAAGHDVTGVDISQEAIEYAEVNYPGPQYIRADVSEFRGRFDVLVSFVTIEHLADPESFLKKADAPLLMASVPNEEILKFRPAKFADDEYPHLRHYTPAEFEKLLNDAGFKVEEKFCQPSKRGEIEAGTNGAFLIFMAYR